MNPQFAFYSDGSCRITNTSVADMVERTIEVRGLTAGMVNAWQRGALIQDAMPSLNADEREFILTGVTPAQWKELTGEDDKPGDVQCDHIVNIGGMPMSPKGSEPDSGLGWNVPAKKPDDA